MLGSIEADAFPSNHPERFELIDVIGEMSRFQETFGYYADPVQHDLPKLPTGWQDRLIAVPVEESAGVRGLCLEVHDLVVSKCVASREKDRELNRSAIRHGLVGRDVLLGRLDVVPLDLSFKEILRQHIEADSRRPREADELHGPTHPRCLVRRLPGPPRSETGAMMPWHAPGPVGELPASSLRSVDQQGSPDTKIALFRARFRGRDDGHAIVGECHHLSAPSFARVRAGRRRVP